MLIILFNGGGMLKSQWTTHPFTNQKTNFINELEKIAKVYTYDPIFYVSEHFDFLKYTFYLQRR